MLRFFGLLGMTSLVLSLNGQTVYPDQIPPSPTASGIVRMIESPINKSTGVPSISIPLYTIEVGGYSLPISLTYNAEGIKVGQVAGNVGMNWSLNTGGSVSRVMNQLPDDGANGFMNPKYSVDSAVADTVGFDAMLRDTDLNRSNDFQPDLFYYSCGSNQGKFFFSQDTDDFIIQNRDDIKLSYEILPSVGNAGIDNWEVTDANGISYFFGVQNGSDTTSFESRSTSLIEYDFDTFQGTTGSISEFNSSWSLRKIALPNGREIEFHYSIEYVSYNNRGVESNDGSGEGILQLNKEMIYQPRLDSITFEIGSVVFYPWSGTREDYTSGGAVGGLKVYDHNHNQIKHWEFEYDHYVSTDATPYYVLPPYDVGIKKRLRLTSVTQIGSKGGEQPYQFDYNGDYLPSLYSTSRDFWGYFNGEPNISLVSNFDTGFVPNKRVSESHAQLGVLQRIHYPTGGVQEFIYEGNEGTPSAKYDNKYLEGYKEIMPAVGLGLIKGPSMIPDSIDTWNGTEYEIEFTITGVVESIQSWVVNLPEPCPQNGTIDSGCPYLVKFDGTPMPYGDQIPLSSLTVGTHTLSVYPQNTGVLDPEDDFFQVGLSYRELDNGTTIRAGGLRVKQQNLISSGDTLTTFYVYQGGSLIALPEYIFYDESYVIPVPCTEALKFDAASLVGNGNETVKYKKVFQFQENGGYIESQFFIGNPPSNDYHKSPYPVPNDYQYRVGFLEKESEYRADTVGIPVVGTNYDLFISHSTKIRQKEYEYEINKDTTSVLGIRGSNHYLCEPADHLYPRGFRYYASIFKLKSEKITSYFGDEELVQETIYEYVSSYHNQLTSTKVNVGSGKVSYMTNIYPDDLQPTCGTPLYDLSKNGGVHAPAKVVTTHSFDGTEQNPDQNFLSIQETSFDDFNGLVLAQELMSGRDSMSLETQWEVLDYDSHGNPLEIVGRGGITISYVWGYNHSLPVAKLTGVSYSEISLSTINTIQIDSNNDVDEATEETLRGSLNILRSSFPENEVSTYTYNPLIGLSSVTDSNGISTFYEYDEFNRLMVVKDSDSHLLQEIDYKYQSTN